MKWCKLAFLAISIVFILAATICSQGIVKKGQVGFRFLENPISAEAIGRGGLGLVTLQNSNTVFWNPAGLGWIESKFDLALNYTKGIAEINHSSIAGAINLGWLGVVAIDALFMDYGDFYGTRRADNEQGFVETGTFSPQSFAIGFSYGQRVTNRFSYGVRIKLANQDLNNAWIATEGDDVDDPALSIEQKAYQLTEPAIDIGAIYDFLFQRIRFGAAIQNFSREIKFEDEKFPLPFAVSFSLTLDPLAFLNQFKDGSPLIIGFETRHPRDFKEKFKFGAEYYLKDMLILRSGYMGNYDERGLTFGFGFYQNLQNSRLRIDYAFQDFGVFNSVHTFSFGISY